MIYLNGKFLPIEQAFIPVLDRGFIFGDGVYEVIPVYSHKPFRLDEHLVRLQNSLDQIRLENPHSEAEWTDLIHRIIESNDGEDQYLYLQITRGVATRNHAFPEKITPTVFMMSSPLLPPPVELRISGIAAITAVDNRWGRCDIKAISLLPNILLRQLAVDAHTTETILLRDGVLTEGAASNIFVVKDGVLLAPVKDHRILPGITYDVVLELAETHGLSCDIRDISEAELRSAQEILLTSSTKEVLPVTKLDGVPVGLGEPGPIFKQLDNFYQAYKQEVMRGQISTQ